VRWPRPDDRPADEPRLLHDRYVVEAPIGQGRSTVYGGTDTRLGRSVAIKRVPLASDHESAERVRLRALREARAAARLDNPNAVTVYDVIEEDGALWLVMELVDAPSLSQLVNEHGPLDHAHAARIGLDLLSALEAAHRVEVVHRDVKPANVLVPSEGHTKLADFGVATLRDETRVTTTGLVLGSPAYMAPEQARGEEVGPPADLWALGATLYFAYEGKPPFDGGSALATASAVVLGEPRPEARSGSLSPLVARLLSKDPAARPEADAVRAELRTIAGSTAASGDDTPRPPAPTVPVPVPVPETHGAPAEDAAPLAEPAPRGGTWRGRPRRRRARGSTTAAIVVAALLVVLTLAILSFDPDDLLPGGDPGSPRGDDAGQVDDREQTPTSSPDDAGAAAEDPEAGTDETAAPTTATTDAASGAGAGATETTAPRATGGGAQVPAGWRTYTNEQAGYTVAYPAGWRVEPAGGPRIDIREPGTGTYLRIDWTDQPKADPVADWREQSQRFASSHEGYEEIEIAPYDYRDYVAGGWEFRYRDGGARLHALDLGFVAGDQGYALYFQTREERWAASQDLFAQLRDSFEP
jgi:eukaryotic-like serine/threonine-protein kinase